MSDLQLSLIAFGALIIAAVVLFNWWQERQLSSKAAGLNVVEQDALLVDGAVINPFDEPNLDEDAVVVTRKTLNMSDETSIADLHESQDEPAFEVNDNAELNHKSVQFDNEPTLDQSSTAWEKLSGQEAVDVHAEVNFDVANVADSFADKMTATAEDEVPSLTENFSETVVVQAVKSEAATAPVTVELTEEELDILNAIPVAPPSFLAKNLSTAPSEPVTDDQLSPPLVKENNADTVSSHHQESAFSLRHDGLPAQIVDEIDFAGVIAFSEPISVSVLSELNNELSALGKLIQGFGLTADNTWLSFAHDHAEAAYVKVAYAIQLADRSGPTPKIILHRFQSAIEAHAKKLGAQVAWYGPSDPSSYAIDLDNFCVQVDQLIRFHLIQGVSGPFTGTKFRGLAESSGLTLSESGAFHYKNDHGQILFSVINADNNPFNAEMLRNIGLRSVNFELDIPRVVNSSEAFNLMMMAAKKMEASLFAQLVDDNQRTLTDVHLEKIRQQLRVINSQMIARGITPGSSCALRLFS